MFDRYRHNAAAVTPIKYECDSKNLTGDFCKIENFACGEINEQNFSNLHPRLTNVSTSKTAANFIS